MKGWSRLRRAGLAFAIGLLVSLLVQHFAPAGLFDVGQNDFVIRDLPAAQRVVTGQDLFWLGGVFPIGFPLIIAAVIKLTGWLGVPLEGGMFFFQAIWMGLASALVYLLAELLWQARLAWLAVLAWNTYPFVLWLTGQISTELPFVVFLYAGIWLYGASLAEGGKKMPGLFGAGLLLGYAMLIRPAAWGVPPLLALFALRRPTMTRWKRMEAAALLLMGTVVLVAPWELFVWLRTERVVMISTGDIPSILDGLTFGVRSKAYREGIPLSPGVATLMNHAETKREEIDSLGDAAGFMGGEWRSNPGAVIEFFLLKAARSWYGTDSMRYESLIVPVQLFYLVGGALGLAQAWRRSTGTRELGLIFLVLILYFWAMTVLVLPILRYMIPAMGLLIVLLPGTVLWLRPGRRSHLEAGQGA